MKRLKNYRSDFEQIKIWVFHIKIKRATGVIGDSRWPKYHPNITHILPDYTNVQEESIDGSDGSWKKVLWEEYSMD